MSAGWTQLICERDWVAREATWEGDALVFIRRPVLLREPNVERCAFCGEPTIFGAYVRVDPKTVAYPKERDDA